MNLHSTLSKYEDPSLSLFHTLQPSFQQDVDDDCHPCNNGTSISEDVFEKFRLTYLTPPRSPELPEPAGAVEVPDVDNFANSFFNTQPVVPAEEPISTDFYIPLQFQILPEFPDLKEACNELFEPSNSTTDPIEFHEQTHSKIKADCMWNGVGHKPRATSRHFGRISPGAGSGNPVAGCVDPRTVFNCRTTGCLNSAKRTCSPKDTNLTVGKDSPNESDEEIDVVTVEKKSSPQKPALLTNSKKIIGKLVQKRNGVHQQLSLRMPSVQPTKPGETREKNQTNMALIINETKEKPQTKRVSYQLKRVVTSAATKRKLNGQDGPSSTVVQLVRLPPQSVIKVEPQEDTQPLNDSAPTGGKRQILSLDGVSMVTDTGINRFRNDKRGWVKSEPVETNTLIQVQPVKVEKGRKKATRRYMRKTSANVPYETPTNSPGSSNGESPTSPSSKKDSTSGSEDDCSIRAAHNVLERQRREGLRTLFNSLRLSVPEILDNERAPKVVILRKAKEHIVKLQEESSRLRIEKDAIEQKQYRLRKCLQELASDISSVSGQPAQPSIESTGLDHYSFYTD